MRMIQQSRIKNWEPYVHFKDEFSPAECEAIINISKVLRPEKALTGAGDDPKIRSSEVSWLKSEPQYDWIFERLDNLCQRVRASWYPFQISGFAEPIQLTHYRSSKGGHYETHRDFGADAMSTRKLSFVMLLNDEKEFSGGELELLSIPGEDKKVKEVSQGTVIAFPAWELHRVLKVTKGHRHSLVCWMHGQPFS